MAAALTPGNRRSDTMPEFAEFSTPGERLPRLAGAGLIVRDAVVADLGVVAELSAAREGGDAAEFRERLERSFGAPETALTVAVLERRIVGFGRTARLRPPPDAPANAVPEGWYLSGLVVHPGVRRRGVGHALTLRRLASLFAHAEVAWYFATAINRPTIALHEQLGFREAARDIWAPGGSFTGGVGVLFRLDRESFHAPGA